MFDKTFILNNYEQTISNTLALSPTARVIYHSSLTTSHDNNKNNIMTDDKYREYQTKSARQTHFLRLLPNILLHFRVECYHFV